MLDSEARKIILSEFKKNIFVIAGAGSGKTTILVNRMVGMVEDGIDVSKICAITFTVNAATKFLNDFKKRLRERSKTPDNYTPENSSDLGPSSKLKRERCEKALRNIDLCFTGTIDSFCQQILSEIPYDAGIPSSTVLLDDDDAFSYYKSIYKNITDDINGYATKYRSICPNLLENYNNYKKVVSDDVKFFSNVIPTVLEVSCLDIQLNITNGIANDYAVIESKRQQLETIFNDLKALENDAVKAPEAFKDAFDKTLNNHLLDNWDYSNISYKIKSISDNISKLSFNNDPNINGIMFTHKSKRYPNPERFQFDNCPLIDEIDNLYKDFKYNYSLPFIIDSCKIISKILREEGKLTFTEYLLVLREVLIKDINNGMNIINHINKKYEYFLLDESQDTSPFQTEIFLLLSSLRKPNNNNYDLRPGSLFIVGDPKQSIYRFKNADIIAYTNTMNKFNRINTINDVDAYNDIIVELTCNFRSTEVLCDYFNDKFNNMDFYTNIPLKDCRKDNSTGVFTSNNYIEVINELIDNPKYLFEGKRLSYKDFMLITITKSNHNKVIEQLSLNRIPYYVEGKFEINNDIINSIYSIYYYVSSNNANNDGAYYNLMTSKYFNLSIENAISYKGNEPKNIKDKLDKIDALKSIENPILLYDEILSNLGLIKSVGYQKLEYAYFVREKLEASYKNGKIATIYDAQLFIKKFINKSVERTSKLKADYDGVYLANLHKVKGLEKPVVILIGSDTKKRDVARLADYTNLKAYIFKIEEDHIPILSTTSFAAEKTQEETELENEKTRLKYVAATRARNYLFIENCSYWAELITNKVQNFNSTGRALNPPNEATEKELEYEPNISFEAKSSTIIKTPSKLPVKKNKHSDDLLVSNVNAQLKGTLIHRLMQLIIMSDDRYTKDDVISLIMDEYDINDNNYEIILEKVFDKIHSGGFKQDESIYDDILSLVKNKEKYCEIPFSYKFNSEIWEGVIDLLYIDNGKYYIVDYKTNNDGDDLVSKYSEQLNAYKQALKEIEGVDAEYFIYHIDVK